MVGLIMFGCVSLLLVWSGVTDLMTRRVPNLASILLVTIWPIFLFYFGYLPWSGLVAFAITFALGYFAWYLGYIGGGDVKLLSAVALFAGLQQVGTFIMLTAILGGSLAVIAMALQRFGPALAAAWQPPTIREGLCAFASRSIDLPYALAIAGAGIWVMSRLMLA